VETIDLEDNEIIKKSIVEIRNLRKQVDSLKYKQHEPIAIVGVGCEFPGGVKSAEDYWELLSSGREAIGAPPSERWDMTNYDGIDFDSDAFTGGYIDYDPTKFDPLFFNITPKEANFLDPQHRLFMEVTWRALEHAGISPESLKGSNTGVFCGVTGGEYLQLLMREVSPEDYSMYVTSGNCSNFITGRISYLLGLKGPSMAIDTACSSSLVAVHSAVQSLRNNECNMALVGGISLMLTPNISKVLIEGKMLSPDGKSKTFDNDANGYARGEGCGVVVLKRLSDVDPSKDNVISIIKNSRVKHDGSKSGLTVPYSEAQKELMTEVINDIGVKPEQMFYSEAHGTGTALGDPIELEALNAVYGASRPTDSPLYVGSVKANFGHLEAAAGIAGLIKVALTTQKREVPHHRYSVNPNKHFDWSNSQIKIVDKAVTWPDEKSYLGSVSSFGASGTNAHAILEPPWQYESNISTILESNINYNKITCWYKTPSKLETSFSVDKSAPFGGYRISKACYAFDLHIGSVPTIQQHKIFGTVVLTGSIYLETTLELMRGVFKVEPTSNYIFQNVTLLKPIVFEQDSTKIQAVIEAVSQSAQDNLYRVKLFPDGANIDIDEEMYASIDIRYVEKAQVSKVKCDYRSLIKSATSELDKNSFYGDFWGTAFTIGEAFHIFDQVWRVDGEYAVGFCRPSDFIKRTQGYGLDKENILSYLNGLLFKGTLPQEKIKSLAKEEKAFIGTGYDACNFYGSLDVEELFCVAKIEHVDEVSHQYNGRATMCDADGNVLCEMENIAFSIVDKNDVPSLNEDKFSRSLPPQKNGIHPVLGDRFSTINHWECQTDLHYDTYPLIGDHTTFDYALFPALGYIHLALNAVKNVNPEYQYTSIKDLKVAQPIMLYRGDTYRIKSVIDKTPEGDHAYGIYSLSDKKNLINKEWGLSSGAVLGDHKLEKPQYEKFSRSSAENFGRSYGTQEFFDYFWGEEFILGASYHFIEQVWRKEYEGLGVIRNFDKYDEKMGIWDIPANFLQIYMSLPLAMAAVPDEYILKVREEGATCIAATIDEFRIYDNNNGEAYEELWSHAVLVDKENIDEQWASDFKYYNASGELVAEVKGVVFKIMKKEALDLLKQSMDEIDVDHVADSADILPFVEQKVSDIIGTDVKTIDENVHLGSIMDSIMALQLRNAIEKQFSVLLPLHNISESTSVSEIVRQVEDRMVV